MAQVMHGVGARKLTAVITRDAIERAWLENGGLGCCPVRGNGGDGD